jgi:flagellar basal body P-ring protein FlgI
MVSRIALIAGFSCLLIASVGCQSILQREDAKQGLKALSDSSSAPTQYIGSVAAFRGLNFSKLEGVGLVTELRGTGSNPPPSGQRDYLIDELKTHPEVENAMSLVASPDTSMVLVKGLVPPGARKGDRFDLEVILPPKPRLETTSLKHGFLFKTRLRPMVVLGSSVKKGSVSAQGRGSVLVNSLFEPRKDADNDLRGVILGGGVVLEDRTLGLKLLTEDNPIRKATSMSRAINDRFTTITRDGRTGVASPKSDKLIELSIPENYRLNVGRYSQVVSQIAFDETPQARVNRLEQLARELNQPVTCRDAALRLEAIGLEGVPALRRGLLNSDPEIRFQAAEALAYLGEADGIDVLLETATSSPKSRWHALTALSASQSPQASEALLSLMSVESAETRYGAFRAFQTRSPSDPLAKGEWLADDFYFHEVPSSGPPMVHLTRSKRPEICLFGKEHQFADDFIFVQNGLTVRADGKGSLLLIRYLSGQQEERRVCSTNLSEAIRQLASLNCSYTEMVELLQEARSGNQLTSRLAINSVPRFSQERFVPDEFEVVEADGELKKFLPNIFGRKSDATPVAEELSVEPDAESPANETPGGDSLPAPLQPQSSGSVK